MITIRLLDNDILVADDISAFSIELDEQNSLVKVYRNDKYIGDFVSVAGIALDDFIASVSYRS